MLPSSVPKPGPRLNASSGPNGNGNGDTSSPSAASPGRGIMSNSLPDPDSLLTLGGRPFDAVNGELNGLKHCDGPELIFFPMMAIANNRLRYQISIYSLVHPHSPTPKPTVNESRPLRFPQILPISASATLSRLPVSHRLPQLRKPVTFSNRECRRESSCRGRLHLEPCSYPPFFGLPQDPRFLSSLSTTPSGCRFPKRSHHRRWLEFVDFLGSGRRGGPR